jgi:hypothetical protein
VELPAVEVEGKRFIVSITLQQVMTALGVIECTAHWRISQLAAIAG